VWACEWVLQRTAEHTKSHLGRVKKSKHARRSREAESWLFVVSCIIVVSTSSPGKPVLANLACDASQNSGKTRCRSGHSSCVAARAPQHKPWTLRR
jgi:hypothetical protein